MSDLQLVILIFAIALIAWWHMNHVSGHITDGFSDLRKCALKQTEELTATHAAIERVLYAVESIDGVPKNFQESLRKALNEIQSEILSAREGIESIRNSADTIADNTAPTDRPLAAGL